MYRKVQKEANSFMSLSTCSPSVLYLGVSKTRGRGRGWGHFLIFYLFLFLLFFLFLFFFQHHRSFVGQIRIKANIKKLSL